MPFRARRYPPDGLPRHPAPAAAAALPGPRPSPPAALAAAAHPPGPGRSGAAPAGGAGDQRAAPRNQPPLAGGPAGAGGPAASCGPAPGGGAAAPGSPGHPELERAGGGSAAHRPDPGRSLPPCPGPVAALPRPHPGGQAAHPPHQRCGCAGRGVRQRGGGGARRPGEPAGDRDHDGGDRMAAGTAAAGDSDSHHRWDSLAAEPLPPRQLPGARGTRPAQCRSPGKPAGP